MPTSGTTFQISLNTWTQNDSNLFQQKRFFPMCRRLRLKLPKFESWQNCTGQKQKYFYINFYGLDYVHFRTTNKLSDKFSPLRYKINRPCTRKQSFSLVRRSSPQVVQDKLGKWVENSGGIFQ